MEGSAMTTYFGIDKTVVILDKEDFETTDPIKFGFGVDILLVPLKIPTEKFNLLEAELVTLRARKGEIIFYSSKT